MVVISSADLHIKSPQQQKLETNFFTLLNEGLMKGSMMEIFSEKS